MLRTSAIGLLLLISGPSLAFGQFNDLQVFGYFQAQFQYADQNSTGDVAQATSFSIPQLNAFLSKQFSPTISAFANAELTNSFSSAEGFGSLRLEEAFVRFNVNRQFRLKAGMLVPTFNNLNDIKNRTPLLPYIYRPFVYESSVAGILDIGEFVPNQAYLHVDGALPVGDAWFDYAAYVGNSEQAFYATEFTNGVVAGNDTTKMFMVGGRVGMRFGGVKVGFSSTYDHDNQTLIGLAPVSRVRIGADLSFTVHNFFVESEFIRVSHNLNATQKTTLQFVNQANPVIGLGLDKMFYYGMLGYNFTEQFFAYGMYSFYEDERVTYFDNGFWSVAGGLGYRLIDAVTLKGQVVQYELNENSFNIESNGLSVYTGVSVYF